MKRSCVILTISLLFLVQSCGIIKSNAVNALKIKAMNGDIQAIQLLVGLYHDGKGIEKDHKEAMKWSLVGAELGDAKCQRYAAVYYDSGLAGEKDINKAIYWATKAAERHDEIATKLLMCIYQLESKEKQEYVKKAVMWSYIMTYKNDAEGKQVLEWLKESVDDKTFQAGVVDAKKWLDTYYRSNGKL